MRCFGPVSVDLQLWLLWLRATESEISATIWVFVDSEAYLEVQFVLLNKL